jgi:hypothetical protein
MNQTDKDKAKAVEAGKEAWRKEADALLEKVLEGTVVERGDFKMVAALSEELQQVFMRGVEHGAQYLAQHVMGTLKGTLEGLRPKAVELPPKAAGGIGPNLRLVVPPDAESRIITP